MLIYSYMYNFAKDKQDLGQHEVFTLNSALRLRTTLRNPCCSITICTTAAALSSCCVA